MIYSKVLLAQKRREKVVEEARSASDYSVDMSAGTDHLAAQRQDVFAVSIKL